MLWQPIALERFLVQLEAGELIEFFQALAEALDQLAKSLVTRTEPRRLLDLSLLLEQLENTFPRGSTDPQKIPENSAGAAENRATGASPFYHLKNAVNLTLAMRELISRLLSTAPPSAKASRSLPEGKPNRTENSNHRLHRFTEE